MQLQQDSQTIIDGLLQARMMLTRMTFKVKAIADELANCGYARTRREVAGKPRDIVGGFQTGDNKGRIAHDPKVVSSIVSKLVAVEGRTRQVVRIMEA